MREGRPSDTAEAMAAARAFGGEIYRDEHILDDPFAKHFLGKGFARGFRVIERIGHGRLGLGAASIYDRILPGSVGWILTRHRYFDDKLDDAVVSGARQVVFVGAGYDSRAFRQPALAPTRIFEIDHPDTQARKKEIVRRLFGALPANVDYVPLNATKGDLRQLPDHGFDRTVPAVFVVEGFLWYMPPDVARDILRAIAEISAPGSQIIFDHILPSVVDGSCTLEGARQHRAYCERRGEQILWGIDPGELAGYMTPLGLRLIDNVDRDVLAARYTATSRRKIKIYPFMQIARAEVLPR